MQASSHCLDRLPPTSQNPPPPQTINIPFRHLPTTCTAAHQPTVARRMVLQRHSSNMRIVRLYAKFLEGVKNDPWNAAKWFRWVRRFFYRCSREVACGAKAPSPCGVVHGSFVRICTCWEVACVGNPRAAVPNRAPHPPVPCSEAEKLEQQAEENKTSSVFDDIDIADPALRMSLQVRLTVYVHCA